MEHSILKKDIEQKIVNLIVEYGNIEKGELNSMSKLNETGIDSLGVVELIFSIEDHYNVSFEDTDDIASRLDFGTIENVVDLVASAIDKKASSTIVHLHSELV